MPPSSRAHRRWLSTVVDADADDGGVLGGEVLQRLVEAGDLGRADERKIARIEKDQNHLGGNFRETQRAIRPSSAQARSNGGAGSPGFSIAASVRGGSQTNLLNLVGQRNRRRHGDLARPTGVAAFADIAIARPMRIGIGRSCETVVALIILPSFTFSADASASACACERRELPSRSPRRAPWCRP